MGHRSVSYTHLDVYKRQILHRISDQETNDQTKAVNFLLAQGKRRIAIIGATGNREDHTLGNISLLSDYLRAGAEDGYKRQPYKNHSRI